MWFAVAALIVATPPCATVTPSTPRWLVTAPIAPSTSDLPTVPPSLEPRVAIWQRIWGELSTGQLLLVDDRWPWIVHDELDCRGHASACDNLRAAALARASAKMRDRAARAALYGKLD